MANEKLYIDIFAGCGGLSTGLLNAGWTGLFAIEKNADAFATLKYNLIDNKEHFRWPKWLPVKECDINVTIIFILISDYLFRSSYMPVKPCGMGFSGIFRIGRYSHNCLKVFRFSR